VPIDYFLDSFLFYRPSACVISFFSSSFSYCRRFISFISSFLQQTEKKKKHLHLETTAAIHHSIVFIYPIENASRSEKKKKLTN